MGTFMEGAVLGSNPPHMNPFLLQKPKMHKNTHKINVKLP